jgi:hypothetical protein
MSAQTEKTIPDGVEQPYSTPTLGNTSAPNEHETENELARKQINGGLDAWLNVVAGFCIFANSW